MPTDYDKIDSELNIKIQGVAFAASEPFMLSTVLARAANWANAESILILCNPRVPADAPAHQNPGWLEYAMRVNFKGGGGITIGAIQRQIGAEVEFHS